MSHSPSQLVLWLKPPQPTVHIELQKNHFPGVNDVPWNSRSANLPALSSLANKGIALDNAYTLPVCTPSRCRTTWSGRCYQISHGMNQGGSYDRYLPVQDGIAARFRKKEPPGVFSFSPPGLWLFSPSLGSLKREISLRGNSHSEKIQL